MNQLTMDAVFETRDQFDQALYVSELAERERTFLRLMFDLSADHSVRDTVSTESATCEVWRNRHTLIVIAEQVPLAKAMNITDRTLRACLAVLTADTRLFMQKTFVFDGRNRVGYVLNLHELQSRAQVEPDTPMFCLLEQIGPNPFGITEELSHPELSTDVPQLSGGSSGDLSGGSSGDLSGLHVHVHEEQEQESHEHVHVHEQGDFKSLNWKRSGRGALSDDDVRRIVREKDLAAFSHLDNEGIRAFGWVASDVARHQRAALWHLCADNREVEFPARLLKARLKDGNLATVRLVDEDWATQFLKPPKTPAAVALPSLSLDPKDVAAAEYFAESAQ